MAKLTKSLREGEKEILKALEDGKLKSFTELREITRLSAPSLSINLKRLLKGSKLVTRDIDSRKYVIGTEGLRWLRMDSLVDAIKSGSPSEQELTSPPVNSIVAIDIPNLPEAEKRVFMRGTPNIAKACFNQFLADAPKTQGSENYPPSGRIVYTAVIDLSQVQPWFDSEEGKKYLKMLNREKEHAQ